MSLTCLLVSGFPFSLCFYFHLFVYLWLRWVFAAAWGLFSSWGERGLLSDCGPRASHCGVSSCFGAWALGCVGFGSCSSQAQQLSCIDTVAPGHVGSSWTRGWTRVSCLGSRILHHWTTREALSLFSLIINSLKHIPHTLHFSRLQFSCGSPPKKILIFAFTCLKRKFYRGTFVRQ